MLGKQLDSENECLAILFSESKHSLTAVISPKCSHSVQVWKGQKRQVTAEVGTAHGSDLEPLDVDATILLVTSWGPSATAYDTVHLSSPCPYLTTSVWFWTSHKPRHRTWGMSYITLEGVGHFTTSNLPQTESAPNTVCAWQPGTTYI